MKTKYFALIVLVGFAGACIAPGQSPTPGESPATSATPEKQRATKEAKATTSPAASPAVSPKAKRGAKKAQATAAAHPTPSTSPGKFNLGDLFKPKTSAPTGAAATTPAPAKGASAKVASNPPAAGGGHGLVWVNSETHVYHREGSRFYGTTRKGKYMTEADAIKEGNKAGAR
jgi:pyruvate/2-oxoglutarate dehydrogenase complex dihydrolipoamide acyltransferase (E2) component